MSGHGGKREGAGRPPAFIPDEGEHFINEISYVSPYGPFEVGKYCGERLEENDNLIFDPNTQNFYIPNDYHWRRIDKDKVFRMAMSGPRLDLAEYWGEFARESEGNVKTWANQQLQQCVKSAWNNRVVMEGIKKRLEKILPMGDLHNIPTKGAVYEIRKEGRIEEYFRPQFHFHRQYFPVEPNRDTEEFELFLCDILAKPEEGWEETSDVIEYLQLVLGSAAIGESHRMSLFVTGAAGSGKTTLTECLKSTFGEMGLTGSKELFNPGMTNHNGLLAKLIENQCRILFMPEAGKSIIQSDVFNGITGRDTMSARYPHAEGRITGKSYALPVFICEIAPQIRDVTSGTIERILTVQTQAIGKKDKNKLREAEDSDSLLVRSCAQWIIEGAEKAMSMDFDIGEPPEEMLAAKAEAMKEIDPIASFCLEYKAEGTASHILEVYKEVDPQTKMTAIAMGKRLSGLGKYYVKEKGTTPTQYRWIGA